MNSAENLTASESQIKDVDYAKEITELTKNQIFIQAGQAMLAHANSLPETILQLLK
ncbi:Flagellin [compost metagenome]